MTTPARSRTRRRWAWICLATLGILAFLGYRTLVPGFLFLREIQRAEAPLPSNHTEFEVASYGIPSPAGTVLMRVYRPQEKVRRAVLLLHGVHQKGYDEARLTRFARDLVRQGFLVATPDLGDLKNYTLSPHTLDEIEACARFLLEQPALGVSSLSHRPGIIGISFSGGLGLVAAARTSLQGRLGYVFSFGGHGDLGRVSRYLAGAPTGCEGTPPPHPYGQAVLVRRFADRFVPEDQVEELRGALDLFLQENPEMLKASLPWLKPEARRVMKVFAHWKTEEITRLLQERLPSPPADPSLSPEAGPLPGCPIFLLHGRDDSVIPAAETLALQRWASQRGHSRALVSGLIRHVELEGHVQRPSLSETYALARFLTELLRR